MQNVNQLLQESPLVQLVQRNNFIGWSYSIDYDVCLVMTNDLWKSEVRGIPHNCFLVAATFDPKAFASVQPTDQEVVLLRVIGSSKLPQNDDLVRTKIDHFKDQPALFPSDGARDLDDITQNEMQFSGLECRILGTFFVRENELCLGSDLESFASAARLYVYRPRAEALRMIVNHVDPIRRRTALREAEQLGIESAIDPFPIGTVRYTSTDRLHRGEREERVQVCIQPSDFLARRTAVLGMTRTGKSNTIKQTVAVVNRIAREGQVSIGQIIYDINGEYANANQQDAGSLADVYPSQTVRYRMLRTEGFLDLRNDFYQFLNEGFAIIRRELDDAGRVQSDYVRRFVEMSLDQPDRQELSTYYRWQRLVAAYKVLLFRAGFTPPSGHEVRFTVNQEVRRLVSEAAGEQLPDPNNGLALEDAARWFEAARNANGKKSLPSSTAGKPWVDDTLAALLDMLVQKSSNNSYITGYGILASSVKYHAPGRTTEVADEIYTHLADGKIVILDLSVGDPGMRDKISRQVASRIFRGSMETFINGATPPNILVYIEEAHNLIGKELDLTEIWPRLAKEGAKYRIGLVYATQEISSVHPNILANTENWFVSHLNNEREVRELSRFYDFGDFAKSLVRAQDVGFARVKTLSSPFVVPVQLDKFDPANDHRGAERLPA